MRVLLTRPRLQAERVAKLLTACGHEPIVAPLLEIEPVDLTYQHVPDAMMHPDFLLITSQQAPLCMSAALRRTLAGVPVAAIGSASAKAARAAGLGPIMLVGQGARAAFFKDLAVYNPKNILFLAGVPERGDAVGELEALGLKAVKMVVYNTHIIDHLPERVEAALDAQKIDRLLLFSPRSAQAFSQAYRGTGIGLRIACMSMAVAQALAADRRWRDIVVADGASLHALLASGGLLCQKAEALLALEPDCEPEQE